MFRNLYRTESREAHYQGNPSHCRKSHGMKNSTPISRPQSPEKPTIDIRLGMKRKNGQDYIVRLEKADPTSKLLVNIFKGMDGGTPMDSVGTSPK